jgi:phage terminase large subunit-like protein
MTTVSTLAPQARRRRSRAAPPPDPVTQYALDVVAGRVVTGQYVKLAAERHLRDLATGAARGLYFDVGAAERAIAFPALLRHYKGEWGPLPGVRREGLPIVLEPWQMFVIGALFGWKRADGTRRFRSVYLEVAKKNGKTLLAAVIAILLAFFDGEPGAEVYAIATKRDQAKIVWSDAVQMIKRNPRLAKRLQTLALTITDLKTASIFRPLGRDSGDAEQGVNPHGAIVDELHVIEDRDSLDNIETAMSARRQPVVVKITTAGVKRESVWAEERADALSVVEGRADDDSMLVLIYTLDEGDDPFDETVWPKSNPNLGVSVKLDSLREQAEKAKRSPGSLAGFLRFRMNIPTGVSTRALSIEEWDACAGLLADEDYHEWEARVFAEARAGYGGLDLASVRDLTALLFVVRDEETGHYQAMCRFYCPEDGIRERSRRDAVPYDDWVRDGYLIATPGNVTDYDYVEADILSLAETHTIGEIGFDRWNATQLATDLIAEGASMAAVSQTHAGLAPGWRELTKLILERNIEHGGHPILRWMAGNVEVETDPAGNEKPSKRHSAERIDGMVALDMAIGRWMAYGEAPTVWSAA